MIQNGTVLVKEKGGGDRRPLVWQEADGFLAWTYVRSRIESLLTCSGDNLLLGALLHTHIPQALSDGFC